MPEPLYEPQAAATLDKIEHDPTRRALWNAICDTIDLVCDHPDSAEARRSMLTVSNGHVWLVPVRCPAEDTNWVLLWRPVDDDFVAVMHVGPWPPG